MIVQAAKILGSGVATVGLAGAGVFIIIAPIYIYIVIF